MKNELKKIVLLFMAVIIAINGIGISAFADETYNTRSGYPLLKDVKGVLDPNEIVKAADKIIDKGGENNIVEYEWFGDDSLPSPFDIFTYEIIGPNGNTFSADVPGEYEIYYIVVPTSGHPAYEISRKIIVRDVSPVPAENDEEENTDGSEMNMEEIAEADEPADAEPVINEADADDVPDEDTTDDGLNVPAVDDENENHETDEESAADAFPVDSISDDEIDSAYDSVSGFNTDDEKGAAAWTELVSENDMPAPEPDNEEDNGSTDAAISNDMDSSPNETTVNADNEGSSAGDGKDDSEVSTPEHTADDEDNGDEKDSEDEDGDSEDDEIDPDNIVISGDATLERSTHLTYPADLGDHSTFVYKIDGKVAYCLESTKASPKKGSFAQSVLENNPNVSKALYYGFKGAGDMSAVFYPEYEQDVRYILTHMATSYFYTGDYASATVGCTASGLSKYRFDEWVNYLCNMPDPPSTSMSLTETNLTVVSRENGVETTSETRFKADSRNSITLDLPANVTYHNSGTGETVTGEPVTVYGGTTFYFTAPSSMDGVWNSGSLNGSIDKVWKALVIKTGTKTQDLGCYMEESVSKSVSFSVAWEGSVDVTFEKADSDNTELKLSGAVIGIYTDSACSRLIRNVTTGQNGRVTVTLPRSYGTVYIRENAAPDGYNLNSTVYSVDLTKNLSMTVMIKDALIVNPVYGQIHVNKTGETLTGYKDGKFVYGTCYMSGVTFEVYAAEDINEHGVRLAANTLADTIVTDGNGDACTKLLPIGSYYVIETQTAPGYIPDTEKHHVTLTETERDGEIDVQTVSVHNDRRKLTISAIKESVNGKHKLSGAVFALYTGQAFSVNGIEIVPAGTCLTTVTTDSNGCADFNLDLPFGKYLIGEIKAPDGYLISDEIKTVDVSPDSVSGKTVRITETFADEPTKVLFSKADFTTGVELDGATMTLLDSSGKVIDTWVSDADSPHMIEGLTVGATYTLREDIAPYGYLVSDSVRFTVGDGRNVQKVIMYDKVPTGTLIINKYGEFLADVSMLDGAWSWISGRFQYITGRLKNVTFDVYAYEDIKNADHVTGNYYNAGDLVGTVTTNENGYAQLDHLPLGKYYVVETGTAEGYVLDNEACVIDLSYRDSKTAVVTYSSEWINERKKIRISVEKQAEGGAKLSDAAFGLFTGEDIKVNGKVVYARDTLIEQKTTDKNGTLVFESDLPVGYEFYVKELLPPAGYASDDTVAYFRFDADSAQEQRFVFTDDVTKLLISKTDIAGEELPGAQLTIINSKGETVAAWTSTTEPHYIEMLPIGEYLLREVSAPDGYVIAEDVRFRVNDSDEIQKVSMVNKTKTAVAMGSYKTGDNSKPFLWITLAGLGCLALLALYFNPWRRRH